MLSLPTELFLHIVSYLDIEDILSLRKTCTFLYRSTKESSLWIDCLHRQQLFLPLPRSANNPSKFSASQLENLVLDSHRTDKRWLHLRNKPPSRLSLGPGKLADAIIYVQLFLDRWLIVAFAESLVAMWDINSCKLCAQKEVSGGLCLSSMASLDANENAIVVAIAGSFRASVFIIYPDPDHMSDFNEITTVQVSRVAFIRALDPQSHLAAFARSKSIGILDYSTNKWATISTVSEDADDTEYQWNGIIALKFCANGLLCIKARSIEVYPLPQTSHFHGHGANNQPPYDLLKAKQLMPDTTFRRVSSSAFAQTSPSESVMTLIAYDVLKGLFHFRISITMSDAPSLTPPTLTVELIGIHNMTWVHDLGIQNNPSADSLLQNHYSRSFVTRGFISACSLGPEGKRGLWIERTRDSTKRAVVVFSVHSDEIDPIPVNVAFPSLDDGESSDSGSDVTTTPFPWTRSRHIDGRPVYTVNSYDLRDDLTHCAFSEVTGRIVVGTRDGSLHLLQI